MADTGEAVRVTGSPDWLVAAACRGMNTDLFYDPLPNQKNASGGPVYDALARRACSACTVRAACLDDALSGPERLDQGYRAGMDAEARKRVRDERTGGGRRRECFACGVQFVAAGGGYTRCVLCREGVA